MVEVLRYLFAVRGKPGYIRSDNGPEFANQAVRKWLQGAGVKTFTPDNIYFRFTLSILLINSC